MDLPAAREWWSPLDLEREGDSLRPVRVSVGPGEVLFLPALWWHAVSQRAGADGSTIAVNYWYEGPTALGDEVDAAAERAADIIIERLNLAKEEPHQSRSSDEPDRANGHCH